MKSEPPPPRSARNGQKPVRAMSSVPLLVATSAIGVAVAAFDSRTALFAVLLPVGAYLLSRCTGLERALDDSKPGMVAQTLGYESESEDTQRLRRAGLRVAARTGGILTGLLVFMAPFQIADALIGPDAALWLRIVATTVALLVMLVVWFAAFAAGRLQVLADTRAVIHRSRLGCRMILGVPGLVGVLARLDGAERRPRGASDDDPAPTAEEIADGAVNLDDEQEELLESVREFRETIAREVMTPRTEVDSVPITAPLEDVVRVVVESGHSRLPVYEQSDDSILGIVHAKDVLRAMHEGQGASLRDLLRPVLAVPESVGLQDLLREMRSQKTQIALVQDERGGTAGVVTVEDILEELVGEIRDEYDTDEEEQPIQRHGEGWIVDGRLNLDDLNEEIGTQFESDEFDTLGGYVFGLFGRQPAESDWVIEGDFKFSVEETDGKRIVKVGLEPGHAPDPFALDEERANQA